MTITRIIGIVLICLGLLGFALEGISFTTEDTVADIGPVEVEQQERRTIPFTPLASGVAIVIGGGLVYVGRKKKS